ncbi:MAG: DUF2231 domain-containing protein, partial [Thermomicrobiales bacterium]
MRSTAQFKGHPIHPILVGFPITFICTAFVADLAAWLGGWPVLATTGAWLSLAAIASGLLAAIPGLIDYFYSVPPASSGKRRATWHMLVITSALTAIALSWAFRDLTTLQPGWGTLLLEGVGFAMVGWGGWMGGTLVYRNQIGVDHRYANAGKWREQTLDGPPGEWRSVPGAAELKSGQMMLLHVNGCRIVLARN